jgi:hypothetical protein
MTCFTPSRATFRRRGRPQLPKVDPLQQTTAGMRVVWAWLAAHPTEALGDSLALKGKPLGNGRDALGKLAKQVLRYSAPVWRPCLSWPYSKLPTGGA